MKVLKSSVSLILVFMMIFSASVFADDTVVNNKYYTDKSYEEMKVDGTEYIKEASNIYRSITTAEKRVHYTSGPSKEAPTQNVVIKFDFRINSSAEKENINFYATVKTPKEEDYSKYNELKVFELCGTSLKYYYSFNYEKDSGITVTPGEWHSVAVEYSMKSDATTGSYTKTYDLYYDGAIIANDVVDEYTDQTSNKIYNITLYVKTASETAPVHFDNVQFLDGALDEIMTFKVLSFEKNEAGTNAAAVFNKHTIQPALLIAAIYENGTYVNMYTKSIEANADTVTLEKDIVLSAGQTVKYMLLNSLDGLVPYCGAVE